MDKLPTHFFVGIVAGLTGAGIMWLCVRDWNGAATVGAEDPESAKPEPARRIGTAEPYWPDAELEQARRGAERVDPNVLGRLAVRRPAAAPAAPAEARLGQGESRLSAFAPEGMAVAASFYRAPSRAADALSVAERVPPFFTRKADNEGVDDALTVALEAAVPYVESGFTVREDYWGGVMAGSARAITHQLFKGNEYWFWAGTDFAKSGIDVHVYDSEGNLAESEHWKRKGVAAARVTPSRTGTHYLIISDDRSNARRPRTVHWAVAYGFR
jgi:hypothetical protein